LLGTGRHGVAATGWLRGTGVRQSNTRHEPQILRLYSLPDGGPALPAGRRHCGVGRGPGANRGRQGPEWRNPPTCLRPWRDALCPWPAAQTAPSSPWKSHTSAATPVVQPLPGCVPVEVQGAASMAGVPAHGCEHGPHCRCALQASYLRKSVEGSQGGTASGELGRVSQPAATADPDREGLLSSKERGNRLFASQQVRPHAMSKLHHTSCPCGCKWRARALRSAHGPRGLAALGVLSGAHGSLSLPCATVWRGGGCVHGGAAAGPRAG
jgi:hypothetical protein